MTFSRANSEAPITYHRSLQYIKHLGSLLYITINSSVSLDAVLQFNNFQLIYLDTKDFRFLSHIYETGGCG
ncbi:hypothetical protein CW304_29145 [Bacillus sp. UFRGS-B20]|nr:hypothetical protein CW304_29145 [Bacillus sp. UFRGS-B20]